MLRAIVLSLFIALPATAQEAEPQMTFARFSRIILALDPEAEIGPTGASMTVVDVPVAIVLAPTANRMRVLVPIASVASLSEEDLIRVMQANFDTALDARYAIAQGRLWSVYVHPLAQLSRDQLISGIGQTVNLATSYGTFYTSGEQVFGRGDSIELFRGVIDDLLERGEEL